MRGQSLQLLFQVLLLLFEAGNNWKNLFVTTRARWRISDTRNPIQVGATSNWVMTCCCCSICDIRAVFISFLMIRSFKNQLYILRVSLKAMMLYKTVGGSKETLNLSKQTLGIHSGESRHGPVQCLGHVSSHLIKNPINTKLCYMQRFPLWRVYEYGLSVTFHHPDSVFERDIGLMMIVMMMTKISIRLVLSQIRLVFMAFILTVQH